ncbi:hypothetical protein SH611_09620 [Geminicoccaceae bacterium 1502E]|nr:hypothetical protein [Geminicoccaceae bacterium 1502E]
MRVLLVEADAVAARSLERRIGPHHEVRAVGSLGALAGILGERAWRPDIIVTELNLPDLPERMAVARLHEIARGIPVVLGGGELPELLRPVLRRPQPAAGRDGGSPLCTSLHQQRALHDLLSAQRRHMLAEIERSAARACEAVVARALEQLSARLGLEDAEGVRLAVRLARAWDAAKGRFVSALATGIASAFLLALGAGIVAMMKNAQSK